VVQTVALEHSVQLAVFCVEEQVEVDAAQVLVLETVKLALHEAHTEELVQVKQLVWAAVQATTATQVFVEDRPKFALHFMHAVAVEQEVQLVMVLPQATVAVQVFVVDRPKFALHYMHAVAVEQEVQLVMVLPQATVATQLLADRAKAPDLQVRQTVELEHLRQLD